MFVMNDDFLEYEKDTKALKSINLDDSGNIYLAGLTYGNLEETNGGASCQ